MRHLVCVCVYEGRADRGVHSIGTTGRISRQLVEPIDKAQHIRHEDVSDEEGLRQPFASCQHRLQVLEPGFEEFVQTLTCRRITVVARERRSEEHTSELKSLMRITYVVYCLKT